MLFKHFTENQLSDFVVDLKKNKKFCKDTEHQFKVV